MCRVLTKIIVIKKVGYNYQAETPNGTIIFGGENNVAGVDGLDWREVFRAVAQTKPDVIHAPLLDVSEGKV